MNELTKKTIEYVKENVKIEFDGCEAVVTSDDVEYTAADYLCDADEQAAEEVMDYISVNSEKIATEIEEEAEANAEDARLNRESDMAEAFWY